MDQPAAARSPIRCSIVVPCFNEEGAIEATVRQLHALVEPPGGYELLVIDDGSSDGSAAVLERLAAELEGVRVIAHEVNRGYGAALKTGIRHASGELIVITDADGTYPNERIPDLVEACEDAEMAVGSRTGRNVKMSKLRALPKAFLRRHASWIAGREIPDINSGLRVFRKDVALEFLRILPNAFSFTTTITLAMLTNGYRVRFLPIDYHERIGRSKIQPIRDTLRFVALIVRTGMYFAPLRVLGPVVAVLGIAFLVSLGYDIFSIRNIGDKTVVLLVLTLNVGMLALLADMIDKRSGR